MRSDFVAFILTHGRANKVLTYDTLRKSGYTGDVVIVIDDEDEQRKQYEKKFGKKNVEVFSKDAMGGTFDAGDNFGTKKVIIFARNICHDIAIKRGYKYYIELDDDYKSFEWRYEKGDSLLGIPVKNLDRVLEAMVDYYESTNILTLAMGQGGDYVGGKESTTWKQGTKRKAMNSFICSVERPFKFVGHINEDVNTYTLEGLRGKIFLTIYDVMLTQLQTQSNAGGMTDTYLDSGTYIKSFYSVMYCPSAVKIGVMGGNCENRIHHKITWNNCVPKIMSEKIKKV